MSTSKITIFLLFINLISFSQKNSKISVIKKNGYYKHFLDSTLLTTDSTNSFYYGFVFYDNDKVTFDPFPPMKGKAKLRIEFEHPHNIKGSPIPIDGYVKWFHKSKTGEKIYIENNFKDGYPLKFYEFDTTSKYPNQIWYSFDFTKKYKNTPGTFLGTYYTIPIFYITQEVNNEIVKYIGQKSKIITTWYRKKKRKWKFYKNKDKNSTSFFGF